MKKAALVLSVVMIAAPALAGSPPVSRKPLPWPATSKAAAAAPARFFPLSPDGRRVREAFPLPPRAPVAAASASAVGGMTEEQARQLLSIYPVQN